MTQKLAKVIAQAGVSSRRKAEELILSGRVSVNGVIERNVATRILPERDEVAVDTVSLASLQQSQRTVVLALHKPIGYVSTVSDPDGKPTVMDFIPQEYTKYRLYPVGRLDEESEGLILLTNDGNIAYTLTHPKFEVPKEYIVSITGRTTEAERTQLRQGIWLKERGGKKKTQPALVRVLDTQASLNQEVLSVTITEGLNRQVRRMFLAVNHDVTRLKRVAFGEYILGDLKPGSVRVEQDTNRSPYTTL